MGSRNKLVDLERACLMSFIFSEIQSLYDSGTPFFTKDNIRKAGEELEHFRKGERENGANITMKGVNGADYQVFVRAPVSVPPSIIQIFGGEKWVIHYSSINHLTTFLHPDISLYNPQSAYLPMRISAIIRRFINYDASLYEKPPAPPADDFSTYQAFEQEWKTSQHYAQFHQILTGIEIPFALTKVIAVTLGSLTTKSQIRKNRFLQHTFVSAIHATLVRRGILSASSDKYVQDPSYTDRCKDLIHSVGLTVIDDPQAWLELDDSSAFISINADIPVRDIVADLCRPGIIIWDDRTKSCDPYINILPYE